MAKALEQQLNNLLTASDYRPLNKSELARALDLPSKQRHELRELINAWLDQGKLKRLSKGRFALRGSDGRLLVGSIRINKAGKANFSVDPTDAENQRSGFDLSKFQRLRMSGRQLGTALNGDRVEVKIKIGAPKWQRHRKPAEGSDEFIEASVTRVIARGRTRIVGTYQSDGRFAVVMPVDPDASPRVEIREKPKMEVISGQLVSVELIHWQDMHQVPSGRLLQVLGWPGDPGVDIEAIIQKQGLAVDFPDAVLDEAHRFEDRIGDEERRRRVDWTDRPVITIDPATAKDHDDAIFVRRLESGGWELAVHIADVSTFVKPGSALDVEAQARGNSTYLVDRVLPMLPPDLSNDLCSLRPGVERLTKCALLEFDPTGALKRKRFYDAFILSPQKFSYAEAQDILSGVNPDRTEVAEMIREAWRLAQLLRRRRFNHGSLDLDFPEISVRLDEKGHAIAIEKEEHNESHQLIEEFMLVANEAVAAALKARSKPSVYRIHEDPDFDRLNEFADLARHHGYHPGDLSNKVHLQQLLDEIKGNIEAPSIKLALLKSLKRAAYSPDPLGHYGLGKADYTHFTSPIRRYADLIVHRSLQPLLENAPRQTDKTPAYAELGSIANHISTTERTSADAENESKKLKLLEYLADQPHQKNPDEFLATVTEMRPMGVFIELIDLSMRALVSRDDLPDHARWFFDPGHNRFATAKGEFITLGQALKVEILRVCTVKEEIDCRITELGEKPKFTPARSNASPPSKRRGGPRKSQSKASASSGKSKAGDKDRQPKGKKGHRHKRRKRR